MEARIAHVESDVSHLRSDVAEIKLDLRSVRDQLFSVGGQLHDRAEKQDAKIDGLKDEMSSLRMDIASAKYWGLAFGMTLAGVMLTVMARGFGWI